MTLDLNMPSEEHELLAHVTDDLVGDDLKHVEANGLAEGSALADDDNVTLLDSEGGRDMHGDVHVTLFVAIVLGNVMHVVPAHDDGALHLGRDNYGLENPSANADPAGEGALLVNVMSLGSFLGSLEAQTNALEVAAASLALLGDQLLAAKEDVVLLLEAPFVLNYSRAHLDVGHAVLITK